MNSNTTAERASRTQLSSAVYFINSVSIEISLI